MMVKDCPHILVIDDDTRLRSLLQRYLQENGFAVSAAKDAENARMFLRQYLFPVTYFCIAALLLYERRLFHNSRI